LVHGPLVHVTSDPLISDSPQNLDGDILHRLIYHHHQANSESYVEEQIWHGAEYCYGRHFPPGEEAQHA